MPLMFRILFRRVIVFSVTIGRNDSFGGDRSCINFKTKLYSHILAVAYGGIRMWKNEWSSGKSFVALVKQVLYEAHCLIQIQNLQVRSQSKGSAQTQKIRSGQYDWLDYRVKIVDLQKLQRSFCSHQWDRVFKNWPC